LTVSHEIPPKQPSQAPEEGTHPVNEAERKLRHLLLAAGFEEGLRGQQIRLDRTIGTTTPDVIYRGAHHSEDEGVCIYLDGLSGHIHGNRQTAEQDQLIRGWLRNNDYEVIEIPASDLDDEGVMTRHFRKLAGYLQANELRETLRNDPSWFEKAVEGQDARHRFSLRLVQPKAEERYVTCVPFVPLKAAAGELKDPKYFEKDSFDWVEIETTRRLREGMFVAQIVGHSMEPSIPDGSYCLFSSPVMGPRQGKTVLVKLLDNVDSETGETYTVKRYESEKIEASDGGWRHVRITLKPINNDFEPIVFESDDEERLHVLAEFVEVLG
jgi:SOS-response transcriptional repressor LexA